VDIDIDNDVIVFTCEYDHDLWVEITPDYDLYVNGERIQLNRRQQQMVTEYYDNFMEIIEQAKVIGKEGAKIGMEGAKIGLAAAGAALKMLACDYDSDDLEEEISDDVEELEERAEELEEMAEELEDRADEFEDLHYSMKREIRALDKLDWF
jgi:DNA repair exonuclease SbcCD ATPase subunit